MVRLTIFQMAMPTIVCLLTNYYTYLDLPFASPLSQDFAKPKVNGRGLKQSYSMDIDEVKPRAPPRSRGVSRRASTGNVPVRFGSVEGLVIDENKAHEGNSALRMPRRNSSFHQVGLKGSSHHERSFTKRLGIRRSMDLTGESINFSSRASIGGASTFSELRDTKERGDYDEPDELRAAVVVEVILRAADVAHNMQSWSNMTKWMSRLFKELVLAHVSGRGFDPRPGWFDNQCKVIESYLMPLAYRLDEMGVFGPDIGPTFAERLESNHAQWMIEGFELQTDWQDESSSEATEFVIE
jgi:hypothetical protein